MKFLYVFLVVALICSLQMTMANEDEKCLPDCCNTVIDICKLVVQNTIDQVPRIDC